MKPVELSAITKQASAAETKPAPNAEALKSAREF